MKPENQTDRWIGTWEEAEIAQLHRDASRSFRDNLLWLEEMTEFGERLAKAPILKRPGFPKEQSLK